MVGEGQQNKSLAAQAAWPLLVLTAVLQVYFGLSAVAYPFMGVPTPASGLGGWTAATMGGLEAVAARRCFHAGRSARSSRHYPCSSRQHHAGLAFDTAVRV